MNCVEKKYYYPFKMLSRKQLNKQPRKTNKQIKQLWNKLRQQLHRRLLLRSKKEREEAQTRQVAVLEALEAQVTSQTRAQDDAVRALQEQLNVATSKLGTELFNQNEKDTENDNEMSGCVKETQEEMKEKEESKAKGFEVEEMQTVPSSEMNLFEEDSLTFVDKEERKQDMEEFKKRKQRKQKNYCNFSTTIRTINCI